MFINKEQVKLVVVDEDGTFLDLGGEDFSRDRFSAVFARMAEAGCRFAVATSNQSFQVAEIFDDLAPRISIIASNGAYVRPEGAPERLSVAADEAVSRVLAAHAAYPNIPLCAVCADGAFCEREAAPDFVAEMGMYSHNMRLVDSLADACARKDVLMYWSRVNAGQLTASVEAFRSAVGDAMDVVDSGVDGDLGYFDVIQRGVSKASGIRVLLDAFGINESQVMAFGDAGNDIEMLTMAGVGVAMGNAGDDVKAVADLVADPCREQGVLKVLEQVFGR